MSGASSTVTRGARLQRMWALLVESLRGSDQDFTTGSINRGIFLLAVPMMLELVLESVFAIVDILFVARLGADAIAVVGLTEAVVTVLYAVAIGLSMAVTAMIARRIGEHEPDAAALIAAQSIWVGIGVSLIISLAGGFYAKEMLVLMGASETVITAFSGYTTILFAGSSTILFIFLLNGVFRGAGDAAIAMRVLWISNAINIVLDPCLIFGWGPFPELGVAGAAVATTTGRGIGVLVQLYYLFGARGRIRIESRHLAPHPQVIMSILRLARGGVAQFFIATSSWIILMKIVASFGSVAVAGYTIAIRIIEFTFLPAWGLSNSAATLVGQNLGAAQPERAERCTWQVAKYTVVMLSAVALVFVVFPQSLVGFFTDDRAIIEIGAECLRWLGYGYSLYAVGLVVVQALNGAGDTTTPTWINLLAFWIVQIPTAYGLAILKGLGPSGVFASILIGESLMAILAVIIFRQGRWQTVQV